jgi:hypothetical protein
MNGAWKWSYRLIKLNSILGEHKRPPGDFYAA